MKPQLVTTADLAEFFQVSKQAVTFWVKDGLPREGRDQFDLWLVMRWHLDRLQARMDNAITESTSEAEKLRKLTIEADLKQLELDQQRGKLVEIDTVIMELSRVMTVVRNTITSLPNKLAPDLTGRPLKEVKIILQKGVVESVRAIDFCSYYKEPKRKRTNGTKEARPSAPKEAGPARTAKNGKTK